VDDSSIASIDANSGLFTGLNRGDALVNAVDAQNFKSGLVNVRVNDFDATLDSIRISYPGPCLSEFLCKSMISSNSVPY